MRTGLAALLFTLALPLVAESRGQPPVYGWEPQQLDGADIVFVDEPALLQHQYRPAGGPSQRYMNRPGAWYVPVFVPLGAGWPVQLWIWQRARTHEVRLLALDAAPRDGPSAAVAVPTLRGRSSARTPWVSAPFAISAEGDGAFILIEQWSATGERPPPIWVQARSRLIDEPAGPPWWASRPEGGELAPTPPPSPLRAARGNGGIIELPFKRRFGVMPEFTPWNDPWAPR